MTDDAPLAAARERARRGGWNPFVYWATRVLVQPLLTIWFRLERSGRDRIPRTGPVILAANHRSVLDPIVVALLLRRRTYYMAKQELFRGRLTAWFLSAIGGFPIDRRGGDDDAMEIAARVLGRGDCLVIFPEGKCIPPGPLGQPRRGVGRLAQATGATVLPVAITGTEGIRAQRIPRRRIRARVGPALTFTATDRPVTHEMASSATERIWTAITSEWRALCAARV